MPAWFQVALWTARVFLRDVVISHPGHSNWLHAEGAA